MLTDGRVRLVATEIFGHDRNWLEKVVAPAHVKGNQRGLVSAVPVGGSIHATNFGAFTKRKKGE